MPREEHAPIGKTFVYSFDGNDTSFPILGVNKDPRQPGYQVPASLSAHPDTARYPNHKFVKDEPTTSDERVRWTYMILPGALVYGSQTDEVTGITVDYSKQIVASRTVTPGVVGADYIELSPIDAILQTKITSTLRTPLPADVTYRMTVDLQSTPDIYTSIPLEATSGIQVAKGVATEKSAGLRGAVVCNVTEKYLTAAGFAAISLGSPRQIASGSTSIVWADTLAVTSFNADFSGHAQVFTAEAPEDDIITGNMVSVSPSRLRFGVFQVRIVVVA